MSLDKKITIPRKSKTLLSRVASVIHKHNLVHENDRVIVAVSGGSDSLALLYILNYLDFPLDLIGVYIDHGLRPGETPLEKRVIEECCRSLEIPCIVRSVNVHQLVADEKRSQEDAARILRYSTLEQIRCKYDAKIIAVGHTADDQVEEFFIRLLRGSSAKGLSGMTVCRDKIVRPLLFENKVTLTDFLAAHNVSWCYDSSNSNRQFLRNRVRLDLLPTLEKEFNPALRRTILQNMDILSEENRFLETIAEEAYTKCVETAALPGRESNNSKLIVKRTCFAVNHLAISRRILEKCCWQMGISPTYTLIDALLRLIETAENGRELHLGDGVRAEKRSHNLIFDRPLGTGRVRGAKETAPSVNQSIHGPGVHHIASIGRQLLLAEIGIDKADNPDCRLLRVDRVNVSFPLNLRSAIPGERFHPCGGPGSKKISRYFNDRKIPAKERPAWPVLLCSERVIALPGLVIDHESRITEKTTAILTIGWEKIDE